MNVFKSRPIKSCFGLLLASLCSVLLAGLVVAAPGDVLPSPAAAAINKTAPLPNALITNTAVNGAVATDAVQAAESSADSAEQRTVMIPKDQASDVRVIIDISGSMKENDPNNLRIPALNLIVEMLPEGSQAGVWTFGQWVNMLIPPETVDQAWRDNAKAQANKINSHGLRTNIGEAMEKATWKMAKDSGYAQSVILLTDGLVDIAGDDDPEKDEKNETERNRILKDILKQYKAVGTKIHTIALSDNADKQLLDRLSLETGGMAAVVRNSEELVKAFVKTFDQAAPEVAEQVPLSPDNRFTIDNSVQEFTALIFRKAGTPAAMLKDPSGNVISQIKGIPNARWFGQSVYDLVTVEQPEAGEWEILAELDPDNRVTVVSDLKMEIENLPTNLFPGQQIDFEVYLHEDGNIVTRKAFLELMTVEMKMTTESGRSGTKVISDPANIPVDGRYKESISRLSNEGEYELQIRVDGKTFQRLRKSYLQVRQPVGFEIRKRKVGNEMGYAVRVVPQSPAIKVADTRVIAKLKGPDKHSIIQSIPWVEEGVWEIEVGPDKGPGVYEVSMNIKGTLGENQEFRVKPEGIELTFPVPAEFTHEYYVKEESVEIAAPNEAIMPDLAEKMSQADAPAEEAPEQSVMEAEPVTEQEQVAPEPVEPQTQPEEAKAEVEAPEAETSEPEDAPTNEDEAPVDDDSGLPIWLLVLVPLLTVVAGLGGFFVYRAMQKKKSAQPVTDEPAAQDQGMKMPDDVSLNDGLDDDEFDEDFDLSDDDEDEEISLDSADDDLSGLDLGDDDDDDVIAEEAPLGDDMNDAAVEDAIPDFDEDFDLGGDDVDIEPEVEEAMAKVSGAEPIDDLDDVLDSALADDDDDEPVQLTEATDSDDVGGDDAGGDAADDLPGADDSELDAWDEASDETSDDAGDAEAAPEPAPETDSDENIDAALANLENELDDIDIEGLMDDDLSDDKK